MWNHSDTGSHLGFQSHWEDWAPFWSGDKKLQAQSSDFRRNPSVRETFPLDFKNYGFKQQTVDIHLSTPIILKKDCMKMCDQYRSSTRILITDNVHTYLLLEFHGCKFEIVEVVIPHLVFIGSLCKRFYGAICSWVEVA